MKAMLRWLRRRRRGSDKADHTEATFRKFQGVRVAHPEVDAAAKTALLREAPGHADQVRTDVDGRDRTLHLGSARNGPRNRPGAAPDLDEGIGRRLDKPGHVVVDHASDERVGTPRFHPLGNGG